MNPRMRRYYYDVSGLVFGWIILTAFLVFLALFTGCGGGDNHKPEKQVPDNVAFWMNLGNVSGVVESNGVCWRIDNGKAYVMDVISCLQWQEDFKQRIDG